MQRMEWEGKGREGICVKVTFKEEISEINGISKNKNNIF